MVDDALDLGARERRVEGDGLEPSLVRRQLPVQHVHVVGQRVGEDVTHTEAVGPQGMHDLVGASRELGVGQRDARRGGDHGWLRGVILGDPPESEPPVPGVHHGE